MLINIMAASSPFIAIRNELLLALLLQTEIVETTVHVAPRPAQERSERLFGRLSILR
jgi:hypothetical protein